MNDAQKINLQSNQGEPESPLKTLKNHWRLIFTIYYTFIFLWFIADVFFAFPTLYQISLWIVPLFHYFAYKRSNTYWFAFYTSIAPLGFLYNTLRGLVVITQSKGYVLYPYFFCVQSVLLLALIGMSLRLLTALSNNDHKTYARTVSYLWILAFVIYNGLFLLQQIRDYLAVVPSITAENVVDITAMITAKALLFLASYYFGIKRKNSIALLLILLIVPMPFLNNTLTLSTKLAWFGFYIYFGISTYRLYIVNRQAESKSVVLTA